MSQFASTSIGAFTHFHPGRYRTRLASDSFGITLKKCLTALGEGLANQPFTCVPPKIRSFGTNTITMAHGDLRCHRAPSPHPLPPIVVPGTEFDDISANRTTIRGRGSFVPAPLPVVRRSPDRLTQLTAGLPDSRVARRVGRPAVGVVVGSGDPTTTW